MEGQDNITQCARTLLQPHQGQTFWGMTKMDDNKYVCTVITFEIWLSILYDKMFIFGKEFGFIGLFTRIKPVFYCQYKV